MASTEALLIDALRELVGEHDEKNRIIADESGCYGYPETDGIAYARTILKVFDGGQLTGLCDAIAGLKEIAPMGTVPTKNTKPKKKRGHDHDRNL